MPRLLILFYGIALGLLAGFGFGFHGLRNDAVPMFGLLPVNATLSVLRLVVGGFGVFVGVLGGAAPRVYARSAAALFFLLAILGLPFPDGLGWMPLGGANVVLHLAVGAVALWIGTVEAHRPLPSVDEGTVTR